MKRGHATMLDVARECGLSKMTVSRVLAGQANVSAKTKDLVLRTSKSLNYEMNTLARNLSSNRSGFIGIAFPFQGLIGSNYFAEVTKGFHEVFRASSYDYALFDTLQDNFKDGEKLAKLYRQRKVDGLLVVAPHTNDDFLKTLKHLAVPLVVIGEHETSQNICTVACNEGQGILLLCEHLAALGHRKIAYIGGPPALSSAARREQAFREFCRKRKWDMPSSYLQPGDYTMRSGRLAGLTLLSAGDRPTAIIASNDLVAYGTIESARQMNLRVPQDISIVGFDDLPTASERCPALTTIHQPVKEMAQKGAELLRDALVTGHLPTGNFQMGVSLVPRESAVRINQD